MTSIFPDLPSSAVPFHMPRLPPPPPPHDFLPTLTSELASAQTTQNEEVEQKQSQLLQLQSELRKGKERLESVRASVCATNRAVTVAKDRGNQASLKCKTLEARISKLIGEGEEMKAQLKEIEREKERGEKQREEYVRKMAVHRDRVSAAEQGSPAHLELSKLHLKKQELEKKRATYLTGGGEGGGDGLEILSGRRKSDLQESIIALEASCALLDEETHETRDMRRKREGEVQKWRRDVDVGRRRQQAQLTRLYRQLHEAQGRRRQWSRQVSSLHSTLSHLQNKLSNHS